VPEFKFMTGLFGRGSQQPKASPSIEHATAGSLASSGGGNSSVFDQSRGGWEVEKAVRDGLERVVWIFRCVDAIAANASSLILNGRRGDPTEGEMYDLEPNLFRLLNRRPNTYESAQQFKYRLSSQLLLSKRGAFIEVEKTRGQSIGALHLLPPNMVEPIPDPKRFVKGYRVKKAGGSAEDELDVNRVIWIRLRPHPLDPYMQLTPLTAAGIIAETDFLARLFNRNFLQNDGRPTTLVTIAGEVSPHDAQEIKLRFSGGPMYAGRTTVIEADGINVADLSASPRDVQWLEGIKGSKDDLLLAFGVPESVMGNASGRTFDNADAEREGFWMDTMVLGHCDPIARSLDPLTGSLDDDNYVAYDYSKINVLQRQKKAKEEALRAKWLAGEITLDELLEGTGGKPLNHPLSRSRILAGGIVIAAESDYAAIAKVPIIGQPQPVDPAVAAEQGALQGAQEGSRSFGNELASRMQMYLNGGGSNGGGNGGTPVLDGSLMGKTLPSGNPAVMDGEVAVTAGKGAGRHLPPRRDVLEGQVVGVLASWCGAQETILAERLTHAKVRKYTRHWEGPHSGDKALNSNYVVQVERWKADLERDMKATLAPVVRREMNRVATEMDNSGFTRMMYKRGLTTRQTGSSVSKVFGTAADANDVTGTILDGLLKVASDAAERHSKRVADRIEEMDAQGATIPQIQKEIKRMIGQRSSWQKQLATYLTTSAIEGTTHETWSRAGKLVQKVWNTVGDEAVRPTHRKVDGNSVAVRKKFDVGKSQLAYPGDPRGAPEETANCRCWTDYEVAPDFAEAYDVEAG
jgi:HK97 family phage portal protein